MKKYLSLFFILIFMVGGFVENAFSQLLTVQLPPAKKEGTVSLEAALNKRKSIRRYTTLRLTVEEAGQLLWAGYGKNKWNRLTCPSAGARYPLVIYLMTGYIGDLPQGLFKYDNKNHALQMVSEGDKRVALSKRAFNQDWIGNAPALIIICADYKLVTDIYEKRGVRYVDMEAGHAAQNIYLQAETLGLGTVAVGAFSDKDVKELLGVNEVPLYIMPVGRIVEEDRGEKIADSIRDIQTRRKSREERMQEIDNSMEIIFPDDSSSQPQDQ